MDLGWRANGIARARAAGGVDLERYCRPGFTGGPAVRRIVDPESAGAGIEVDETNTAEADPTLADYARRTCRHRRRRR
jgi:hypothetical protein